MAAGAATFFNPPSVHSISSRPTARLPANAATMTSGRVVRSIMKFLRGGSEAGRDAGGNGLEEDRRPVMEPEPQRAEQQRAGEPRGGHGDDRSRPARADLHFLLGGNRLDHLA